MSEMKCVIVIDEQLPAGVIANTAAVLSLSLGQRHPGLIGADLPNSRGERHLGITTTAIPILKSTGAALQTLRESVRAHEQGLTVVDLISATRSTRSYQEYAEQLARTPAEQLEYQGVALCGPAKLVKRYTGSLGLLR